MKSRSRKIVSVVFFLVLFCVSVNVKTINIEAATTIPDGVYTFQTKVSNNQVLDVVSQTYQKGQENCANVETWTSNNGNNQKFNIKYVSSGWFNIINVHSGKALDVEGGKKTYGVNVIQYTWQNSSNQLWKFEYDSNGYCYIKNKLGYYLDVNGNIAKSGTNVQVWKKTKSNAQKWKLIPTSKSNSPKKDVGIKLQTYMTNSMKQGDYAAFVVNGSNIGCMATAYAIGYSCVDKKNYSPTKFWNGSYAYDPLGRCGAYICGFNASDIYNNLKNGKPSLLHYYYSGGGEHWITIIGIRSGVNPNALQAKDFIVVDPASGTQKGLADCYRFSGGTIKGYKKY